ncbi:MAG: histidine triad nucleotide-binding protein [Ruminococcaceae bacterium]|nr:histidine triad nucleotide-binding protein [Oscillospiraceae bacterium]
MDCLFCKIINGDIPSTKVYEDDKCYAFRDISPQGPTHILVIPKEHIQSVNEINDANKDTVGHIFTVISKIAKEEGIAEEGYRVVSNIGEYGQQTVPHLHFHIIGGRNMKWPPG